MSAAASSEEWASNAAASSRTQLLLWPVAAVVLIILPMVFVSGSALSIMCTMAIMAVFALSYNVLLGQTGMLSFAHAIFFGFGGLFAAHAMNILEISQHPVLPLLVIPLAGGVGGLVLALPLGALSSGRSGTIFAMITLGFGELVNSSVPLFDGFYGGEAGISTNRGILMPVFGFTFGPQIQVYYLIAAWSLICAGALYFITCSPFGRAASAVRENAERAEFVGFSVRKIRFLSFCIAGFFAGMAGGLAAINFEIITADSLGTLQSAMVVLMAYIGGIGYFVGPVVGAVIITLMQSMLSDITPAWQLYLGLTFIAVVLFLPGGLVSLPSLLRPSAIRSAMASGRIVAVVPAITLVVGLILAIEMGYQAGLNRSSGPVRILFGIHVDVTSPWWWALVLVLIGGSVFALSRLLSGTMNPRRLLAKRAVRL